MRILILTGIFPPDIGGPATQLDALIRELIKNNYQVKVLTFGQGKKDEYPYPVKKISRQWPFFLRSLFFLINGFFSSFKSDILYSQDLYTAGLAGLIIKKIAWETIQVLNKKETPLKWKPDRLARYTM